jgi:hypothetical protein
LGEQRAGGEQRRDKRDQGEGLQMCLHNF